MTCAMDVKSKNSDRKQSEQRPSSSPLLKGSGLATTSTTTKKIELYLNLNDLTHIITHKSQQQVYNPSPTETKDKTENVSSSLAVPPKTYMTRSGSLLLFSENRVLEDRPTSPRGFASTASMGIHGHGLSARSAVPRWGRFLKRDTGMLEIRKGPPTYFHESRKKAIRPGTLHRRDNHTALKRLTPTKNAGDGANTVNSFSEQVLSYTPTPYSSYDKYMAAIQHGWKAKQSSDFTNYATDDHFGKVSRWTRTWIGRQDSGSIQKHVPHLRSRHKTTRPKSAWQNDCLLIEETRLYMTELRLDRTHVNTPVQNIARQSDKTFPKQSFGKVMDAKGKHN